MTPEWLTAIGTIGTFIVIAASAGAALMQIRHMRSSNQIAAYNECRETMDSAAFRDALHFIRTELPKQLSDRQKLEDIWRSGLGGEYGGIRLVANLFESMGLFVRNGMMDERIACELWSGIVLSTWNALRPLTAVVRSHQSQGVWINFEYMAVLSKRFTQQYPEGHYPAGVERLPLDEPA